MIRKIHVALLLIVALAAWGCVHPMQAGRTLLYGTPSNADEWLVCSPPGMVEDVGLAVVVAKLSDPEACGDKITAAIPMDDKHILSAIPRMGAGAVVELELAGAKWEATFRSGSQQEAGVTETARVTPLVQTIYSLRIVRGVEEARR